MIKSETENRLISINQLEHCYLRRFTVTILIVSMVASCSKMSDAPPTQPDVQLAIAELMPRTRAVFLACQKAADLPGYNCDYQTAQCSRSDLTDCGTLQTQTGRFVSTNGKWSLVRGVADESISPDDARGAASNTPASSQPESAPANKSGVSKDPALQANLEFLRKESSFMEAINSGKPAGEIAERGGRSANVPDSAVASIVGFWGMDGNCESWARLVFRGNKGFSIDLGNQFMPDGSRRRLKTDGNWRLEGTTLYVNTKEKLTQHSATGDYQIEKGPDSARYTVSIQPNTLSLNDSTPMPRCKGLG